MSLSKLIACHFETDRLVIRQLDKEVNLNTLVDHTIEILSPEVTKSLPPGWQDINDREKALHWLNDRKHESVCLLLHLKTHQNLIGFIFLYSNSDDELPLDIRFGYLLDKTFWGKGLGTEVLKGFIEWSKKSGIVNRIEGGVEKVNIGSIKVLGRVGFSRMNEDYEDTYFYEKQIL